MRQSVAFMGTIVTIEVVDAETPVPDHERDAAIARAFDWFREVEATCTRFDESSELMRLCRRTEIATPVSEILFAATETALAVAEASGGAFDPTAGHVRSVALDAKTRTITLLRPVQLDLNAVAKGLAVDLAARELRPFTNFVIDAGGDLYASGKNADGDPWRIGIRHPSIDREVIATIDVSDAAVCTSGNYERRDVSDAPGHIIDPKTGAISDGALSATVVAVSAMLADAMSTAAFVIGGQRGLEFLERHQVEGLLVTKDFELLATRHMVRRYGLAGAPILPHA